DLHVDRARGHARRLQLVGRITDRTAGATGEVRPLHRARPAPGACRDSPAGLAPAQDTTQLARLATRDADGVATPQRQPTGVEAVGLRDHQVDAPASDRG